MCGAESAHKAHSPATPSCPSCSYAARRKGAIMHRHCRPCRPRPRLAPRVRLYIYIPAACHGRLVRVCQRSQRGVSPCCPPVYRNARLSGHIVGLLFSKHYWCLRPRHRAICSRCTHLRMRTGYGRWSPYVARFICTPRRVAVLAVRCIRRMLASSIHSVLIRSTMRYRHC